MSITVLQRRLKTPTLPWGRFGLRGVAISYLALLVLLPLTALAKTGMADGPSVFWRSITNSIALGSLRLTLMLALLVSVVNACMGTFTAYALVRFEFPGKQILNVLADVSFAIPTLVTGVMLVVLYGPQTTLGAWFGAYGMQIIFARPGIMVALLFVTYPFVIRTVQPVLLELSVGQEEAAYTIGASSWMTFRTVVLPQLLPSIVTGSLLSFARALGEFGSIVVVAGNIPFRTLTAPVYLFGQIESENVQSASAVSILLLALSFGLMLAVDIMRRRATKFGGKNAF